MTARFRRRRLKPTATLTVGHISKPASAGSRVGRSEGLFALLESTGEKESLLDEVRKARQDPLADATVLADGAAALRRAGLEAEAFPRPTAIA